jgi:hypothetical protein
MQSMNKTAFLNMLKTTPDQKQDTTTENETDSKKV